MDQAPLAHMAWSSCTSLRSLPFGFLVGTGSSMEGLVPPKGIIYIRSAFTYLSQGS